MLLSLENLTPAVLVVTLAVIAVNIIKPYIKMIHKRRKINKALEPFPSLPRHWLYGSRMPSNTDGANSEFLQKHLDRAKAHPRSYRVWSGPYACALLVVHPELVRPVLKVSDPKSRVYTETLQPWLGEGLLISKGPKWLRNRRLLTPAFHFDVLNSYVDVFNDATDTFMNKLDTCIEKKQPLCLFEHVSLLTLDIILQCAFSYETNCQLPGKRHPYITNVYDLAQTWYRRTKKVMYVLLPFTYWLSAEGRHFKTLCDNVHKEADIIIASRKKLLEEKGAELLSNKKNLDFLDILLTAQDEEGQGMSPSDIRAEVDTFLFEGHDTTASGLSWTLYLMAKHPEYQSQVQEEVDNLMTELGTDRLDRSVLSRLPVLTRCLKESMRLYPPVPIIGRVLSRDLTIDGHVVLEGTSVNIPIWAVHHNPKVWGEDHMEFKPERFTDDNMTKQDPFAFIPFSAGPRNCIGQNFALSEEKLVLARVLHRYTFSLPEKSQPPAPSVRIVLRSEEEIQLNVLPRS